MRINIGNVETMKSNQLVESATIDRSNDIPHSGDPKDSLVLWCDLHQGGLSLVLDREDALVLRANIDKYLATVDAPEHKTNYTRVIT